jgi:hypothetical protein
MAGSDAGCSGGRRTDDRSALADEQISCVDVVVVGTCSGVLRASMHLRERKHAVAIACGTFAWQERPLGGSETFLWLT